MDVAIGLPNAVAGATGEQLVAWARRADARGFSSLGALDRIVYESYEPLAALSAAAAVTERIRLVTAVLLGPLHPNAVVLAKQALSLQALSGGRFTLGIGLGAREDDYEVSDIPYRERGRRFDEQLEQIREVWEEAEVGPTHAGAPGLVVGGGVDASYARVARFAEGWIAAAIPPDAYAQAVAEAKAAWAEAGREGEPRTMGIVYFSLGEKAEENARLGLGPYYAWLGEAVADFIVASAATDAEAVRQYLEAFEQAGCGELVFFPATAEPEQVDLLADAVGL